MKRQTYLRDENLLTLLSLHDFIIPEIQREYVWGSPDNCNSVLIPFLESIRDEAQIDEHCHYAHSQENHHIGFLYSYKPQYICDLSSRIVDEYLIDGQQRFTTLFILLLVRAVRENRMMDFCNLIRWDDGSIAFDYKVRQLTHRFIYDLVEHFKSDDSLQTLKDITSETYPCWLLKDYQNDMTVSNIMSAIKCIEEVFSNSDGFYYDYLLTKIHFWHFKTDVTSQGEELYITMNSRGEELSNNEMQKSRKLKVAEMSQLKEWGRLWEEWQTYFWRNRAKGCGSKANYDADKGFNNLIACVDAMENSLKIQLSSIEDIKKSVEALQFMVDTDWNKELQQIYPGYYTDWISTLKQDIWAKINTTDAKWLIEKDTDTTQRENAVFLWPLFYYFFLEKSSKNPEGINKMTFVRLMHLCYLNFHSRKTNDASLKTFVQTIHSTHCNMTNLDELDEENRKFISKEHLYVSRYINDPEIESLIWKIQDKSYFLDGEDVGGDTIISYLEDIATLNIDVKEALKNLIHNYDIMFPKDATQRNEILLKRILLYYEDSEGNAFWRRVSPYYDRNYETSSWKRIVRHGAFLRFYKEISNNYTYAFTQDDLSDFIGRKQDEFFSDERNRCFTGPKWDDRRLAIFFDIITDGQLWIAGNHKDLGFHEDFDSNFKVFMGHTIVGNRVCGRRHQWQYKQLPDKWECKLQKMYPLYTFTFE